MATSIDPVPQSPSNVPITSHNLSNFSPCQHTFVATRVKQSSGHANGTTNAPRQYQPVPRVCRLRRSDNTLAIYSVADPIDTHMVASDVCSCLLVEQLGQITFDDDSYKEKLFHGIKNVFYESENRLLQMTFDHAEEKLTTVPLGDKNAEKILPTLEEAESGAFFFATAVTQSYVYFGYVGTIRAFLIAKDGDKCFIDYNRPQFFHSSSLHTLANEEECTRLKRLDVDIEKMKHESEDKRQVQYTRCIGKLSEKLLSSEASANDVNEARCNPLICEPKFDKFSIYPHDFALVIMTDKVYQMYLQTGVSEEEVSTTFPELLNELLGVRNPAEDILTTIENKFQEINQSEHRNDDFQELGILIHFFQHQKTASQTSKISTPKNSIRRAVDGEITVDEVKNSINKNQSMQLKREKHRNLSRTFEHVREDQSQNQTIDPFVQFDVYNQLLNDNVELREADKFITDLLYTKSTAVIDEQLNDFLTKNPSLKCD